MSRKREYDAAIGGDVVLENHVHTYRYASAAIEEIRSLLAAVKQPTGTKLIFQTLPKHMRRRAMSHHPKRLPIKYRSIHIAQMAKSGKQRDSHRPSRKYRRRPRNLLQDYLRRQRKNIWLETHIWHAKRFHMIDRWGYRLPLNSCDKTFRACYRATVEHCLLQDISFYNCIELQGKVESIFAGLKRMTQDCITTCNHLTIKAITYLGGKREGSIDLFRKDQCPESALCRATFMWRPTNSENFADESLVRTLWFWLHPCVYTSVVEDLVSVFQLEMEKHEEEDNEEKKTDEIQDEDDAKTDGHETRAKKKDQQRLQFMTKNSAHERIKRYANSKTGIKMTDLKDTLNRFRLTGPLSQSVLLNAFRPKELPPSRVREEDSIDWFQQCSLDEGFSQQHTDQAAYWKQCHIIHTPALVVPNMILGLNIVDPRLQRPSKRTKAVPESGVAPSHLDLLKLLCDLPKTLPQSPLWDEHIRKRVRSKMLDTKSWCLQREKHALVPGAPCAFEDAMQPIPVILIQRPGVRESNRRLNYGCGWDIIAPAGYAMPIWMTLIMWGARPGGLRELHSLAREMGTEVHLPDTVGGRQQTADRYAVSYAKYFRLPPGKRNNYRKLAIVSPFRPPWLQLVRDWLQTNGDEEEEPMQPDTFYVERDKMQLQYLNDVAFNVRPFPEDEKYNTVSLIQLQLRLKARGNVGSNALICLPTAADIRKHFKNILRRTHTPVHIEPLQPDLNEKERKVARLEHKKQLKRSRAKRVREKRALQETSTTRVRIRKADTSSLVEKQFERMSSLWLPNEDCSTYLSVRKQCSRETIGYVTEASFSFTQATVCAVGYVTYEGLMKLLKMFKTTQRGTPMCLLRDVNSRQYYFATFEISPNP